MNEDIYNKIKQSSVHLFLITLLKNNSLFDFSGRITVFRPLIKLLMNISEIDELLDLFVWPVDKKEANPSGSSALSLVPENKTNLSCVF